MWDLQLQNWSSAVQRLNSNAVTINVYLNAGIVMVMKTAMMVRMKLPVQVRSIWFYSFKTLDTVGNCQRPTFSLCVSQHVHKITYLWKFELNWSSKLLDIPMKEKTPLSHEVVCFQMLVFPTSNLILRSRNPIRGKLLLSRKLRHFRGSRFPQCFILSTSPHDS